MRMKSLLLTAFAFLFITVELSLSGVDILPDIAGYLVLFFTFGVLAAHEPSFNRSRLVAVPLVLLEGALLMRLTDNDTLIFVLHVAGVLLSLLMGYFAFTSLGRLAATYERDDLRKPVDGGFIFYAFAAALPLLGVLFPDIKQIVFFVTVCLGLYVSNLLIRCYRLILLPVPEPEFPEGEEEEIDYLAEFPDVGMEGLNMDFSGLESLQMEAPDLGETADGGGSEEENDAELSPPDTGEAEE